MRVLAFDTRAVPGGAERALAELAGALPVVGVEVAAVVGEEGPLVGWLDAAGCPVVVGDHRSLAETVASWQPDVMLNVGARSHAVAGPIADQYGVSAVWWRELTPRGRPSELTAAAVPTAAVVCATAEAAASQRGLTPAVRVAVIPPGRDIAAIAVRRDAGRQIRRDLGWEQRPIVGMVARLDPAKGQDLFVNAAALVAARVPEARFAMVGGAVVGHEGDWAERLSQQVVDRGLTDRAHLAGHVDDPIPWQAALDVAVCASQHEAFGLSVLESMALGVPVVATPTDGPTDLLDGGRGGVIVERIDAPAIADGVLGLLRSPEQASELARRAAKRALAYDVSTAAGEFARLFSSLTAPGRVRGSGLVAVGSPLAPSTRA